MWVSRNEASGMWCPFARVMENDGNGGMVSGNRAEANNGKPWIHDRHMCLAENCMAWRENLDKRGFCGLAGPPLE